MLHRGAILTTLFMCGISGIVNRSKGDIDLRRITILNNAAAHRGPDDHGYYRRPGVALGHRRLAILDLSAAGHQPMSYGERYWISYNGEIYNYLELREELVGLGHVFRGGTDTEVLLAAWAEWGLECLTRLNGMWAFALFDSKADRLYLARDRFGEKPLHYINDGQELIFSSEIKQITTLTGIARANAARIVDFLLTHNDGHTDETMFAGVRCVPAAHYMVCDLGQWTFSVQRYYDLRARINPIEITVDEASEQLKSLLDDAVRIRLRSDVRVGTCVSGGLDSSAICGLAAARYHGQSGNRLTGIHARSIDSETDESPYAERVASHLGIDLKTVTPSNRDFLSQVEEVVFTQEEPFGSPSMFMGWNVFREARSVGCKVMLNGQGGDEILLGYERYFAAILLLRGPFQRIVEAFRQSVHSGLSLKTIVSYYLYFTNPSLRIRRLKTRSMLRQEIKNGHDYSAVRKSAEGFRSVLEMQCNEVSCLQLPHLLRYEDRNSMRHSVETRLPFLDPRLVEFCVSLAPNLKIEKGWTKYVLRNALADQLPNDITWRKRKLGFEAPERSWIGGNMGYMCEVIRESRILEALTYREELLQSYARLPMKLRWAYFNVAIWERVFGVKI